ncbi:hypothetical protein A6R68_18459 [Neotoma lepida]|uniref:Uncharacterized protein n=1 Tax=Neotoma lepida TaxID=56216 RepID=A0A1A6HMD6_NEOLE|nr:hypothetical protein A6R68_18459 [Neotoma lepida]
MSGEAGQPEAGPSHNDLNGQHPEGDEAGVPEGVIRKESKDCRFWVVDIRYDSFSLVETACKATVERADTRIISLSHLEMTWNNRKNFPALLVRILYKSKLKYYGKPNRRLIEPYQVQTYLEVADNSGMVSVILWNALCPEWYKSLRVGLILLLQNYTVKQSHPFRIQPNPVDPQMKLFSTMEICLNLRHPPTNIVIISEKYLKSEWKLPNILSRFITRSELDNMPENSICDVIGVLSFVGRVQRSRKRDSSEDFWAYRWIHIVDGTSEQPFIVQLFSTSQPEVFENINPMTKFICTQLRVVRNNRQVPNLLYLTTTNESRMFINGHRGQPYTSDTKVKNFIQWVKRKTDSEVNNNVIGGYYPYPPVPETFSKYSRFIKDRSLLTAISEVRKVIKGLQYREQKRVAIQGIITAIKYIPHKHPAESAPASEVLQDDSQPSTSQAARREDHHHETGSKRPLDDIPEGSQSSPVVSGICAKRIIMQDLHDNPEVANYHQKNINFKYAIFQETSQLPPLPPAGWAELRSSVPEPDAAAAVASKHL